GDVNCDKVVDILDVIKLNKYLLGSDTLEDTGKANADVDESKEIDSTDSLNILKCVVEVIDQKDFPITK
ncbi:MAG: dockerin type I repeat-containing protein, partial [Oscillospiraceae bacterium]|nr:dockerin type I repeat-containing protein [Oscillospiraceae bacterium]